MNLTTIQRGVAKILKTQLHNISRRQRAILASVSTYFFILGVDIAHAGVVSWVFSGAIAASKLALIIIIPGIILTVGIVLFNASLEFAVLDFYNSMSIFGDALKSIWMTVRDMANIMIIGAFVYISISIILSIDKNFKHLIINLITVAILINFSFFFAQTAIDIANWASVQIYNTIIPERVIESQGLGEVIVEQMGGVKMVGSMMKDTFDQIVDAFASEDSIGAGLITAIGYLITTIVLTMLAGILLIRIAFIFIARMVMLLILMASSSFAFAAMLIPPLNKYWVAWRNGLIYNSLVAPLLLIMLYMVTILMGLVSDNAILPERGETTIATAAFAFVVVKFFIGIGLLWGAIRIATTLSNRAAESMGNFGKNINGLINTLPNMMGRGTIATAGWAGRGSIGMMAHGLNNRLNSLANNTNNRFLQRQLNSFANSSSLKGLQNGSFDVRQNKTAQKFMKEAGLSVGSGIKDGFKQLEEAKKKQAEKHDKNQYDARMDAINSERTGYNTTDAAKKAQEEKLLEQEREISSKERQLAEQEREHANNLAEETRAEQAQEDTIEQKKRAIENIKAGKEAASHTIEESEAQMTATTTEINRIESQIQAKTQEIQVGIENGTLLLNSPELQNAKTELNNLRSRKKEHKQTKNQHEERIHKARTIIGSTPKELTQLEQELADEQSRLQALQTDNSKKASERANDLSLLQKDIKERRTNTQQTSKYIEELDKTAKNYISRWNTMLSNTRMAQAVKSISRSDREWLARNGVVIDEDGRITKAPTQAQLDTMPKETFNKMNKLLNQQAESTKFMSKILQDSSMSNREREEQKRNKSAIELLANLRSGDINISNVTKSTTTRNE
jgi:hypothetical protein